MRSASGPTSTTSPPPRPSARTSRRAPPDGISLPSLVPFLGARLDAVSTHTATSLLRERVHQHEHPWITDAPVQGCSCVRPEVAFLRTLRPGLPKPNTNARLISSEPGIRALWRSVQGVLLCPHQVAQLSIGRYRQQKPPGRCHLGASLRSGLIGYVAALRAFSGRSDEVTDPGLRSRLRPHGAPLRMRPGAGLRPLRRGRRRRPTSCRCSPGGTGGCRPSP